MKDIGIYQTRDGERYHCRFYQESGFAFANGPSPNDKIGVRGNVVKVQANSIEEAREKLAKTLGPGKYL